MNPGKRASEKLGQPCQAGRDEAVYRLLNSVGAPRSLGGNYQGTGRGKGNWAFDPANGA